MGKQRKSKQPHQTSHQSEAQLKSPSNPSSSSSKTTQSNLSHKPVHLLTDDQTIDEHIEIENESDIKFFSDPQPEDEYSIDPPGLVLSQKGVFEHLSTEVKLRLTQLGRVLEYPKGATLNSVGDPCQGLGIILRGQIKVEWMDALGWEPIATMGQGDVLGALEWAESKIWEERITAYTSSSILFIPSHLLHSLIATYPDLQRQTERYTERHNLHTLLGIHPLFQGIADHDLMCLVDLASLRYVSAGTILFAPNMILALLFVIGRGEIELSIDDRPVQVLERGEIANLEFALGDVSLLLTARVTSESTLYVLPFDEVEVMLAQASRLHLLKRQAHLLRARALNE